MGGAVFPPYLTWGQTMVDIMKVMANSFRRSHTHTATLSTPNPQAGYTDPCLHWRLPDTQWASLGQSLVGSLLFSPGSWCTQGFVCALRESVSPVLCKFWQLYGGVNGNLLQEGLYHIQVYCTQSPCPWSSPLLTRTFSGDTQTQFCLSLCGGLWVLVCPRYVWALWASLSGMRFDSKCHFTPPTILLGLLICPCMWGISSKSLQLRTAAGPAPTILLGILCP